MNRILNAFRKQLDEDPSLGGALLETALYADYQMRLADRYYNIPSAERTEEDKRAMFLLCGPFRFVCAYYPYLDRHGISIPLPEEMTRNYVRWYRDECGRYRMLLARLLSFAGVPAGILEEGLERAFREDTPLAYDAMPSNGEQLFWELCDRQERIRRPAVREALGMPPES